MEIPGDSEELSHAEKEKETPKDTETVGEVFESLTEKQKGKLTHLLNSLNLGTADANVGDVFVAWLDGNAPTLTQRELDRLAHLLVTMARSSAGRDTVDATQQQLADLLGVSRVTLGAAMGELARLGQVEQRYRQIRLLDSLADRVNSLECD